MSDPHEPEGGEEEAVETGMDEVIEAEAGATAEADLAVEADADADADASEGEGEGEGAEDDRHPGERHCGRVPARQRARGREPRGDQVGRSIRQ